MIALILILIIAVAIIFYCLSELIYANWFYFCYHPKNSVKKVIALTFDDGPNSPYTSELLEILDKHQVRATFFACGQNLEKFPELGRAIFAGGHVLGNHAYSHDFSAYFKSLFFEGEILKTQAIIKNLIGREPALFRAPWLFKSPFITKTLKQNKLTVVNGIFGSAREITQPPAEKIFRDALSRVKPGMILVLHDGFDTRGGNRAETIKAVDLLIPELKKQDYAFLTVDKLLNISAYQNNI